VELFERIRREYEHGAGTIKGVAKKLGIHRRMVREALANAMPPGRKVPVRERPRLEPLIPFIDAILATDKNAPRKQRHTARRIFNRVRAELSGAQAAESTVRQYVRERKRALGLTGTETFIPQSSSALAEAVLSLGAGKPRWIGMKPASKSMASRRRPTSFVCGAWPAAARSIAPFPMPASWRFWKRTRRRSVISEASSPCFVILIGIGAAVTRRPLPHHRAYGSVHGGSSQLR